MPMFLARGKPDDIAGPNFLDGPAFPLSPAAARSNDQGLTERMRVPSGPRARLERDAGADDPCRIWGVKQRIDADRAGKIVRRSRP